MKIGRNWATTAQWVQEYEQAAQAWKAKARRAAPPENLPVLREESGEVNPHVLPVFRGVFGGSVVFVSLALLLLSLGFGEEFLQAAAASQGAALLEGPGEILLTLRAGGEVLLFFGAEPLQAFFDLLGFGV